MWPEWAISMPIPGMDQEREAFYRKAKWDLTFVLWPKRCDLSNKWLWFRQVYKGTAVWTGPGEPVYEFRYHEPMEHIIWQLKYNG